MESRTKRAKLASALRWLAPSAAAASTGAVVAGAWEGLGTGSVLAMTAAAGFVAVVGLPILFVTSAIVRGLWAAWRPHELALVDEDGAAPRLAGWVATVWLGLLGLAWVMFQGTWLLAAATAFKPSSIALLEPVLAVAAAIVIAAASRPAARGLTWLFRAVDTRWRKRVSWSLVSPIAIALGTTFVTIVTSYLIWRFLVKRRVGTLDLAFVLGPLAGIAATALVHALWRRLGRARRITGAALGALALALIGVAAFAWQARPNLTLSIWGDRPIAGLTIDKLLDLDEIRARVSLAAFRPIAKPDSPHPDIVLITIDTVRADHTPPYAGSAEMPLLAELGIRGSVFEWAFAPSNVTRRSIPSMVIGLAPNRVRGRVVGWALRVDPRHVLVAERLRAGGYDTAGFVCCYGFWGNDFRTGLQRGLAKLEIEPNGMKLVKLARAWIEERDRVQAKSGTRKPLFMWIHILEPHNWHAGSGVPTNDDERRRFYDRALTGADTMLVEVMAAFMQRAPEHAPIVVVTADHGEGLGQHDQPYHSTDLYNSQIRVPLVIAGPGIRPGRVSETVSLTDLTPTLLDLAGFEPPSRAMDGRSFADLATGRRQSRPDGGTAFAAMIKDRSNPGGVTAIVRGGWKLVDKGGALELFNIHEDPDEERNVLASRPQVYDELRRLLQERVAAGNRSPFE